jgi:superfamily II DNA or RNA helicase
MATGTGKTLTALNCILEDYKLNNFHKFIVLVPTTALAQQWFEEISNKFNFNNPILCCSENINWKLEVKKLEGKDIEDGILTLTSASTKAGAGEVWVDQDGSLRQQISSLDEPTGATKPRIYLVSKRIEVYPYKEAWVETTYEKQ